MLEDLCDCGHPRGEHIVTTPVIEEGPIYHVGMDAYVTCPGCECSYPAKLQRL